MADLGGPYSFVVVYLPPLKCYEDMPKLASSSEGEKSPIPLDVTPAALCKFAAAANCGDVCLLT